MRWTGAIAFLTLAAVALAACGPFSFGSGEKTIFVGPYQVECVGVAPQKCLLVREEPGDEWRMYYDQIQGFDYEPGFEYELRILEEKVENPPADASSIRWVLQEVASKTRSLEGTVWVLESYLDREGVLVGVLPGSEARTVFQQGQVAGNASCNSYFGTYLLHGGSKLTVSLGGMTEMYCSPETLMAQEQDFLAALDKAAAYTIVEDRLQIEDVSGQEVLVFSVLQSAPLVGTLWQLTGYSNGAGGFVSVLAETEITATFGDDGTASGSAGCNNYAASYEIAGNQISLGPAASTMMICPEPIGVMEQEQTYLAALQSASTYDIEGTQLSLYGPDGQVLMGFTVREPTPLVGTTWQAIFYNNGKGGAVSTIIGTEITAFFDQDGNLAGSAGCNNYTAAYEAGDDTSISIGPAASTRKFCAEPEGTMDQESQYLAALETAATYRLEGDKLELRTEDGALVASYQARQQPAALDSETLKNLEYRSDFTQSGTAPLVEGEYREPAAPGSATETVVTLTDSIAYGQMDGQEAAAVILVTDPGGSGTFYDLAIVVDQGGQPLNVATTLLGDRVQIHGLSFSGEEVIVKMITHGPEDPMCCPSQEVIETYALQGGELIQSSSQVVGSASAANASLTGVLWKWEQFLESNDNTILVEDPDQYTLEFLVDGKVAIQADCNQASGTYTVESSNVTIEVGPTTLSVCPPGSLSDQYLQYLGQVSSYVIDGGKLALALRYDTGIMTFIK